MIHDARIITALTVLGPALIGGLFQVLKTSTTRLHVSLERLLNLRAKIPEDQELLRRAVDFELGRIAKALDPDVPRPRGNLLSLGLIIIAVGVVSFFAYGAWSDFSAKVVAIAAVSIVALGYWLVVAELVRFFRASRAYNRAKRGTEIPDTSDVPRVGDA